MGRPPAAAGPRSPFRPAAGRAVEEDRPAAAVRRWRGSRFHAGALVSRPRPSRRRTWLFDHRLGIALVACLPAWVGTFESDVPWATLHVAALGVAIGLSSYIPCTASSAATGPMGLGAWRFWGLLASIWYGAFLTIDDRWATGLDAKTGERVQTEDWQHASGKDSATIFSDTCRVFGRQLIHRDMTHFDEKGHLDWEAGGPMSESGKPHGHWTTTLWEPRLNWTDQWYWYGEEVSEGQWHLRNRD